MATNQPSYQPRSYPSALTNRTRQTTTPFTSTTPFQQPHQQPSQPPAQPSYQSYQQPPNPREARELRTQLDRDGPQAFADLTEDQRDEVDQAFKLFDLDQDTRIDYHELKVALKALGFEVPKAEILSILQTYGTSVNTSSQAQGQGQQNKDGGGGGYTHTKLLLPLKEFQGLVAQRILARDPREEILRAFELFDEGQKGKISLQDLERVARELGEGLQHEELVAMIEEFDLDGDGCIDREEFLGICLG
ncbi:MAG: hypothetical protein Q9159_001867 [Coniocarpon cinnabarinum]